MKPECKDMLPGCAEAFGRLDEKLDSMGLTLDRVYSAINGNGQPGLAKRVTVLEASSNTTEKSSDYFWKVLAVLVAGGSLVVSIISIIK
jgi:hypothetical protein